MSNVVPIASGRSLLDYALAYARLGWYVIPLEPGGKRPLGRMVPNGQHDATLNPDTIRRWWTTQPDANIGIVLAPSGLVAVDLDPRNGGIETMDVLEAQHGRLESDVYAFTGGGGEHRVFTLPAGLSVSLPGKLGPGVDLKVNGYIVAEPSVHTSGKQYQWEASSSPLDGMVPSPLPDWLRNLAAPPSVPDVAQPVAVTAEQWDEIQRALPAIDADDRDTWIRVGMALHSTGCGQAAFTAWDQWSQRSDKYDARDQMRVWRSFKSKGLAGVTYRSIFAMAQPVARYEVEARADGLLLTLHELQARASSLRWVVKHVLPDDSIGVLFGASGAFKSFLALDAALHVAHGMAWLGRKTMRGDVVYLAAEGGAGLMRRIDAWHKHRGLDWRKASMRVCPVPLTLNTEAKVLREAIEQTGMAPRIIVIDTMSQTFVGEENSANEVAGFFRTIGRELRDRFRCCIVVVHHSGHSATERPRGSSAITANVDFMFAVHRDEHEMLATLTCAKQKDAEKMPEANFRLSVHEVAKDEDGEEIKSLAASHIDNAATLVAAVEHENRAGRGSNRALFLSVAAHGEMESFVRSRFYEALGDKDSGTKRQAWFKCRNWAIDSKVIDIVDGKVYRHE